MGWNTSIVANRYFGQSTACLSTALAIALVSVSSGCAARKDIYDRDLCADVLCAGHGRCVLLNGYPHCECDPGYEVRNTLSCVAKSVAVAPTDAKPGIETPSVESPNVTEPDPVDNDGDNDGFDAVAAGGDDCDDTNDAIHPSQSEGLHLAAECLDGLDNDCDGNADWADLDCYPPESTYVYWADAGLGGILRVGVDGTGVSEIVAGLDEPDGLAIDRVNNRVYWADSRDGTILRAPLGEGSTEVLVRRIVDPDGLALDSVNGKVYWTTPNKIFRADADGSSVEAIIAGSIEEAQGIALDPLGNRLCFTDKRAGQIECANLDGTERATIVTGLDSPFSVAIEPRSGFVFWTDRGSKKVQRANLDGSGLTDIASVGVGWPFGIAVDVRGQKVYWIDRDNREIMRANLDGSQAETVLSGHISSPTGLVVW